MALKPQKNAKKIEDGVFFHSNPLMQQIEVVSSSFGYEPIAYI